MLYYAIATIVAFALFGWFVFANSEPVVLRLWPSGGPAFETWPWVIALVGAVVGILLEFVFTRGPWQRQQRHLETSEASLRKARAKIKGLEEALAKQGAELEALRGEPEAEGIAAAAGEGKDIPAGDDEEPI